jgi:hypothetical protein
VSMKDGAGTVVLRPEEPEDMWHVYNLIGEGDLVRTTTFRKARAPLCMCVCMQGRVGLSRPSDARLLAPSPDRW